MKNSCACLLLLCLVFTAATLQAQHVFSAGPMLHYNFGGKTKGQLSWGVELAYWNAYKLPYGFDIGLDFEKDTWRIYTEAQASLVFAGASAGPYLAFKKDAAAKLGLQTSIWANAYLGIDFRARFTKGETRFAPGLYAKYLFTPGGNLWNEFEENHEGGGDSDWD